jgi:hypothetical protein
MELSYLQGWNLKTFSRIIIQVSFSQLPFAWDTWKHVKWDLDKGKNDLLQIL